MKDLSKTMLDDLNTIKRIDTHGLIDLCVNIPEHSRKAMRLAEQAPIKYGKPRNIVVAGMGGSAIGGELLHNWLVDRARVPIEVCRDHMLPAYADKDTLVFAVSYSGETEETLNAFEDAVRKGCMVVSVTSGGRLQAFSNKHGFPCVVIPKGLPPRMAFPYLFFPLATAVQQVGVVKVMENEVEEVLRTLKKIVAENTPNVPVKKNWAKGLALKVLGTIPVVYAAQKYAAVAHRWKTQFNENSKLPSKYEVFPELNHNEVVGWENAKTFAKTFSLILLRDRDENPRIKRKIELTKDIAFQDLPNLSEIYATGESALAKMLSLLCIGDFVSIYLAILRRIDPFPVKAITKMKEEMMRSNG